MKSAFSILSHSGIHIFRSLLLMVALFGTIAHPATAQQSRDQAKARAKAFFANQNNLKSAAEPVVFQTYESPSSVNFPVHIFQNEPEGFVVLVNSGNDYVVAGYSSKGQIKAGVMPEGLRGLVDMYEKESVEASSPLKSLKSGTVVVSPLLDEKGISLNQYWHPEAGNCPTGCVATAFTQLIAYNEYPAQGIGSHCYTHPEYGQLCADFENTTYDWGNMTDVDFEHLSFQVAIALEMKFCGSRYGSSPGRTNYSSIMKDHFGLYSFPLINKAYNYLNELDHGRPFYCELPGNPGHAVVIDGYDSDGYYHLNFGWGGFYNGYFRLNTSETFYVGNLTNGYTFGTNIIQSFYVSGSPQWTAEQDSLALVALHNSLGGGTGWNLSQPVCMWEGIGVFNGRVKEINLSDFNPTLEGIIPPEIGNLDALSVFSLDARKLDGPLPESLFSLTNLTELSIDRGRGNLSATLSPELGNLTNLEKLRLPGIFEGNLSPEIGNLINLEFLNLSSANITGNLPEEISNLVNLKILNLSNNQLTGPLPNGIGNLDQLVTLDLAHNELSGSFPESIGQMDMLQYLHLNDNAFAGGFPESIGNCKKILNLQLQNNFFTGDIPSGFGNMTTLQQLNIRNNQFTSLPDEIGQLTELTGLDVGNNELTALPDPIINLKSLISFRADSNQIAYIPENIGGWPKLQQIDLSYNQINFFPEELCNLTDLWEIRLDHNRIKSFPASIAIMPEIVTLKLNDNEMQGNIPEPQLSANTDIFDITNNYFTFKHIPVSENLTSGITHQKAIPLKSSIFKGRFGDTLKIDIRDISNLSHPDNQYFWFKTPEFEKTEYFEEMEGEIPSPVLTLVLDETTLNQNFYCKVFNPDAPSFTSTWEGNTYHSPVLRYLNTEPVSFELLTHDDVLLSEHPDSRILSSTEISSGELTDQRVVLASPFSKRGEITWQGSADGENWVDISSTMQEEDIRTNLVSFSPDELVLSPKTPVYYRCVLTEGSCDPLISDKLKVNPFGEVLFDEMINVATEDLTIAVDSIEVTIPANLSEEDFRLTITKLDNPPAAPEGYTMGSVYDVTVSLGNIFTTPLLIKLKNIDLSELDAIKIPDYEPVYYHETQQEWVSYNEGGITLQDSTIEFYTTHLTKLGWWEFTKGSYTHRFTSGNVEVIYKFDVGNEDYHYLAYQKALSKYPAESWRTSNTDPNADGAPYMVQDIAGYLNEIITKFDDESLVSAPWLGHFGVYLSDRGSKGGIGHIGVGGYAAGYINLNTTFVFNPNDLMQTLAHEYMHYAQSKYMPVLLDNYFFAEAHAPLADRIVWNEDRLEKPEPLSHLKDALNSNDTRTIYDLLGNSWDAASSLAVVEKFTSDPAEANTSGAFLHYMRSYRNGTKLDPIKVIKDVLSLQSITNQTWRTYMNNQTQQQLGTTLGNEFDDYVRYLLEGGNPEFTILNNQTDKPFTNIIRNSGAGNNGTFARRQVYHFKEDEKEIQEETNTIDLPYLSAKVLTLTNNTPKRPVVVTYTPNHEADENIKVYHGHYDFEQKQMVFKDISDSTKYSLLLWERSERAVLESQNTSLLLFVNKKCPGVISTDRSFMLDFDLQAMTVLNISDLAYANVTDRSIHSYTDGQNRPFLISGRMFLDHIEGFSHDILPDYYSLKKTMIGDSTYQINVSFRDRLTVDNGPTLAATTRESKINQIIEYNFLSGHMKITQHSDIQQSSVDFANPVDQEFSEGFPYLTRRETHFMELKNVLSFEPGGGDITTGETMDFKTSSTQETQNAIVKLSHTFSETSYNVEGEVAGGSSAQYTGTDYSGDVKVWLQFHEYEENAE